MPSLNERWEDLCHRCGDCCYEKDIIEGNLAVDLASPCPFHDPDTRLCRVYETRFEANPRCEKVGLFKALFSPWLPPHCGYQRLRFWKRRRPVRNGL